MQRISGKSLLLIFILLQSLRLISQTQLPDVLSLDPSMLHRAKELISSGSRDVMPAYAALIKDADKDLLKGPYSVKDKTKTPPDGDKHNYFTLAVYWWPNPNTKDGLPYIYKDGVTNPDSKIGTDARELVQMCNSVFTLALAYYFSGEAKYAKHASELLKAWFIDSKTKMNPNLNYAQAIPGRNEGSPGGIIDSRNFINITEAAGLLEGSASWTESDHVQLQSWFKDYLKWLITSKNGEDESEAKNNHATFYCAQVVNFALFSGDRETASQYLEKAKELIASQIDPDGSQPYELKRTKSFSYSVFNLEAFYLLAEMGNKLNADLYNYQTDDGRSLHKALDYLAPYADPSKKWSGKEISGMEEFRTELGYLLLISSLRYPHGNYADTLMKDYPKEIQKKRSLLLYPIER